MGKIFYGPNQLPTSESNKGIFYGNQRVKKVYYGNTLIYEYQETPSTYTFTITITDRTYVGYTIKPAGGSYGSYQYFGRTGYTESSAIGRTLTTTLTLDIGSSIKIYTANWTDSDLIITPSYKAVQEFLMDQNRTYTPTISEIKYYSVSTTSSAVPYEDGYNYVNGYLSTTSSSATSGPSSLSDLRYNSRVYVFGEFRSDYSHAQFTKEYVNSNWTIVYDRSTSTYYEVGTCFYWKSVTVNSNTTVQMPYWRTLKSPSVDYYVPSGSDYGWFTAKNNNSFACDHYLEFWAEDESGNSDDYSNTISLPTGSWRDIYEAQMEDANIYYGYVGGRACNVAYWNDSDMEYYTYCET